MGSKTGRTVRIAGVAAATLLWFSSGVAGANGAVPTARSAAAQAGVGATPASCSVAAGPGKARCYLNIEEAPGSNAALAPATSSTLCDANAPSGLTACNIESAYGIKGAVKKDGAANLVAVVDPYDDPNVESDLAKYRKNNQLPACTTANGCFEKVNQSGQTSNYPTNGGDSSWAAEIAIDTQMVSAVCPLCHILLVEANSNGFGDLTTAESEAVTLGAHVVSNSWGNVEFQGETAYDATFDHPGVDITFSSGDGAYAGGVQYPSASPFVTSVGGTDLNPASDPPAAGKRRRCKDRRTTTLLSARGAGARPTNRSLSGRRTRAARIE